MYLWVKFIKIIVEFLSEKAFSFTPNEYIAIHKKLFTGIYGHGGKMRNYNITKKEWVLKRFTGHKEEWGTFIDVKRCTKPISKKKLKGKTVFLASVTDCYNPYEEKYCITQSILKQLLDVECTVSISTKSSLILRDVDLLKQFKDISVAMSVNTLDESFKNDMDNASSIEARMNTLKVLHENGIHTVLFMSPIFPAITDYKKIIEKSRLFVDEYWFENLNLRGEYKARILRYVNEKYPQYADLYKQIYVDGNKSYWNELADEIEAYCTESDIIYTNFFYHEKLVAKTYDRKK